MHTLGIFRENGETKAALLHFDKKKIEIRLLSSLPDVKPLYIVSGLNAWDVFIREIPTQLSKKRDILATLPFQSESFLPYPLEKGILIPFFEEGKIRIFSATQDSIASHLEELRDIDPDIVSCVPQALYRFATFFFPHLSSFLYLHIGEAKSFLILFTEKKIVSSQTLNSLKDLDRALEFLKQKTGELLPKELIVSGNIDQAGFLKNGFEVLLHPEYSSYAIPIGLGLEGLFQDKNTIQFRQGPFLSPSLMKKRKTRFLRCAAVCACLTLSTWLFTHLYIHQKEKGNLEEKVFTLQKKLRAEKTVFPFVPTVPKVSDFLTWLSVHPKLSKINVKNVEYALVKYPKLGLTQEGYKAKVSIEFTSPSLKQAREFREALGTDPMIDKQEEISWKISQETYFASFYLRKVDE